MKKIIRLTESDLTRIVRRVIMEQATAVYDPKKYEELMGKLKSIQFGDGGKLKAGTILVTGLKGVNIVEDKNNLGNWLIYLRGTNAQKGDVKTIIYECATGRGWIGRDFMLSRGEFDATGKTVIAGDFDIPLQKNDGSGYDSNYENLKSQIKPYCPTFLPPKKNK